ncbi:hypothetical protein BJN34_22570 [Cupriavidus necator]|uniref:Site-specific DNA-methyltransferase (adenine-specific) n=1 Tax=Cupriavidus necator TaxID=106590 RepID=A0A1U9UWR0_CUPNE|nr:Dam family site-specific DNA-(adenine-N6)-methyltransferase [Cupriavidus necator]AQV96651.1 hypothetical protein BJN34_22570 [Cupriavidus necator]
MKKHPSSKNSSFAPFLKWIGGKSNLMGRIEPLLREFGPRTRLVEPFVGGGSVFLRAVFNEYLLVDANPHLVELYQAIQTDAAAFIRKAKPLFAASANCEEIYYAIRSAFNKESDALTRAAYFLYMNKFGYRGIARYSGKGHFNTPFGHNKLPGFPEQEILAFADRSVSATFRHTDFTEAFRDLRPGDIVYCDPPYLDTERKPSFRDYVPGGFSIEQQRQLADLARAAAQQGIPIIVSNHLTPESRALYHGAVVHEVPVERNLNPKAGLRRTTEGLFVFEPRGNKEA